MRTTYVYRLVVTYPEGIGPDNPPKAWCDYMDSLMDEASYHDPNLEPVFHWPARRRFFDRATAERRAGFLREYGCTVTVERSKPIEWEAI